jgi:hypothetical protein
LLQSQDEDSSGHVCQNLVNFQHSKRLISESQNFALNPSRENIKVSKAVPLHAKEALGGRGDIAPTHSRPRH